MQVQQINSMLLLMQEIIKFCRKCHQRVRIPSFAKNVKVESAITIECDKCKSKVKIKAKEIKTES